MALYDPNEFPTETVTSPDFTLADVLAWARTKPADEAYDFCNDRACAVAQYGLATGQKRFVGVGTLGSICPVLRDAAMDGPWTFGAFADRLEKALS